MLVFIPQTNSKTIDRQISQRIETQGKGESTLIFKLFGTVQLNSILVNLSCMVFSLSAGWHTWIASQPLPVSYSRVCVFVCVCVCVFVRACVRVSWGRVWGLGEMELWVGSNIMIHFLYIAVSHMAHILVYYTLLVVIIICIMFVKLRKCWRML